jgi:hypothetical protein
MTEGVKTKGNIAAYIAKQFKNRNIFIFMFFLLLSAFLWFLNYVNKEHSTYIRIPYKFENLPSKAKVSKETADQLTVQIYGHGYNLLREMAEQVKLPVVIDFANKEIPIVFHKLESNPNKSFILTDEIIPFLSKRFGNNIKVTGVNPDTLFFDFAESFSKKVPVINKNVYKISPEYMLNGKISTSPDSVWVYGPKHITDTITAVYCEIKDIVEMGESHVTDAKLKNIKDISYSKSKVIVNVPVEKFTETSADIYIKLLNAPDSLNVTLIPDKVQVYYKVPLSLYEKINKTDFEAVADFSKRKNENLSIELKSTNPYIEITKSSIISTSFILERKKQK